MKKRFTRTLTALLLLVPAVLILLTFSGCRETAPEGTPDGSVAVSKSGSTSDPTHTAEETNSQSNQNSHEVGRMPRHLRKQRKPETVPIRRCVQNQSRTGRPRVFCISRYNVRAPNNHFTIRRNPGTENFLWIHKQPKRLCHDLSHGWM